MQTNDQLPGGPNRHFISVSTAITMTKLYRKNREQVLKEEYQGKNILPLSETFERAAIDALLAIPGCASLRFYYSMDENEKLHLIVVPANERNEDMLPPLATKADDDGSILEQAFRCPPSCPPASPLNQ